MQPVTYVIRPETAGDAASVEDLNAVAFGPGRFARTAYRLREGVPHDPALSFVAVFGTRLGGSVRLTPILIGGQLALLLGPLAVHPDVAGRGAGRALVRTALDAARVQGHAAVLLVGDLPYYGPLGFAPVKPGRITLPGPVDPARLLLAELQPGAAERLAGAATRAGG